jgi:hypothetical protein
MTIGVGILLVIAILVVFGIPAWGVWWLVRFSNRIEDSKERDAL